MRAFVNLDFGGHVCFGERFFQHVLFIGPRHIVVGGDRNEELCFGLCDLKMRTVRPIGHKSATVE